MQNNLDRVVSLILIGIFFLLFFSQERTCCFIWMSLKTQAPFLSHKQAGVCGIKKDKLFACFHFPAPVGEGSILCTSTANVVWRWPCTEHLSVFWSLRSDTSETGKRGHADSSDKWSCLKGYHPAEYKFLQLSQPIDTHREQTNNHTVKQAKIRYREFLLVNLHYSCVQ